MRKRALSLLLTLAFCLTMLPTAALAEETDTQTGTGGTVYTVNADTALQSTGTNFQSGDTGETGTGDEASDCPHNGGFTDGVCNLCDYECPHTNVENGKCSTCQMQMVAQDDSGKYYDDLEEAFDGVASGGTVTMLTDVNSQTEFYYNEDGDLDDKTVMLTMNNHSLSYESAPALQVESGKLIISDEAIITQTNPDKSGSDFISPAVDVYGGTLEFKTKATITGGLSVSYVENGIDGETRTDGTLVGGLKEGSIITSNGEYSVLAESKHHINVMSLLAPGCAFAKYNADGSTGELVNGYVNKLTEDVIVVEHTHSFTDGKCACGYTCSAHDFENGVCKNCGYVCPHEHVTETRGEDRHTSAVCDDCNAQMAVKVTVDRADTYYAQSFETYKEFTTDNTLKILLNNDTITPSGCTITLLADGLDAYAFVDDGKNIKLDLNGKTLAENMQGIAIDPNSTLAVTGEGSSTRTDDPDKREYSYVFNVRGGTLKFDDSFGGTFNGIRVGSGTLTSVRDMEDYVKIGTLQIDDANAKVTFRQGTFDKIAFGGTSGSVTLGELLGLQDNGVRSGCAFQKADGTFLPYNTVIDKDHPVENVKIAACLHDSVANGTCDYCGMENLVAAVIDGGGSIATYAADSDSEDDIKKAVGYALNWWSQNGDKKTLKPFVDFTLENMNLNAVKHPGTGNPIKTQKPIDLNGHTITGGTLAVNDLVTLTITDSSANKGSFSAGITVNGGASLIVDGVPVDEIIASGKTDDGKSPSITLKPGAKFKSLDLYYGSKYSGLALADCLEPGSYLVNDEGTAISGELNYTYTASINPWIVKQIDGTVTADEKTGNIPYGGTVPESLNPTVTMADGSTPSLTYTWYYRTEIGTTELPSEAPNVGETLDAFCVITAKDSSGNTLWATSVTGYTLTVTKGQAAVTKAPAAIENLTYNGETQALVTAGEASGGEMQYSTEQNGAYSTAIPTVTDAEKYTVWYKVVGDSNHEDTTPESVEITIAPKKVALTGGVTAENRTYEANNTAVALNKETLTFDGLVGEETLDATLSGGTVETADAGENKPVTYTAELTDGTNGGKASNYMLTETPAVTVKITKADAAFTAPAAKTLTYNGGEQALVDAGATADGTMLYSLSETGEYSDAVPTGKNVDTYTVWYKVAGDSNHNDSAVESVSVTIAKAKVTVTAVDKTAYIGSTAPDLSKPEQGRDYTVSGLFGEDKLTTAPTLKYVDANGKEIAPDMTKTGETKISAEGASADANYELVYADGRLTVTTRPSSGGGSSSTKTETTTNPDGSTTKIETKSDGTVTSTTTNKDGSTTKTETKKDGSSTTEVKDTNGSTGTVCTDKSGKTTASATISEKAVDNAKKSDEAVKVPTTEIKAGESSASAPTVKIDLPKNAGETKVEIPVKDVTSGTVAIIVKPDGTEEIVKDSLPTENGIELTVNGDVTVKIVDNAKNFADTEGHWAQDAIDFVSARGLVNGTSGNTFSPEAPTTRAQLWTMLARQADADTTGGATWYEKAQTWAKNSGISDGTNPNGTITRAEMVTMLWRAAGSPVVNYAMNMTDVPADSYYTEAVRWALSTGITTGVGEGRFDPNSTCTRAQIATFLYRTYQNG